MHKEGIVTGAFDKLFHKKQPKELNKYFAMLDGYSPVFSTYEGGVYEMELTRACIQTFAGHVSKLQPHVTGADLKGIQRILDSKVNPFMTCSQFLSKVATLYETHNTCYIVPVLDRYDRITGYYPINPATVEIVDVGGEPWLKYTFYTGEKTALPLAQCGVLNKFLYHNDLVGETNQALTPTMQLLSTQNQGIAEGIKNSASLRFMATLDNFAKDEDIKKKREQWVENNLGSTSGGLAIFPNLFKDAKQIQSVAKIVDPDQMRLIESRVYTYFGTNQDVLQNKAVGDSWSAYYEGKIELISIQLSQAMTAMTYTRDELARKNAIVWSANRLQYMTNQDKLQVSSQLFDRGILSTNDVMDIWNLPHVENGDKRYIRKEYTEVGRLDLTPTDTTTPQPIPTPTGETQEEEVNVNPD